MDQTHVYIVLMRTTTLLSCLIHRITGAGYTHASLSLDKDLDRMFSFGRRYTRNPFIGCFRQEHIHEGIFALQRQLPGMVLELDVDRETYRRIEDEVNGFQQNSRYYGYNYITLFTGIFGAGFYSPNRYVCSEFVYEVLNKNGVCDFGCPRHHVHPEDFVNIKATILFEGDLKEYKPAQRRRIALAGRK